MKKCTFKATGALGIVSLVGFANHMANPEASFGGTSFVGLAIASAVAYFLVCIILREQ